MSVTTPGDSAGDDGARGHDTSAAGAATPAASAIRRLDHIAVAVADTDAALATFRDRLGLRVAHSEELSSPRVRLTYLDCGNAFIQLVEPLDGASDLARWVAEHGDGLHHLCFGVDDPLAAARALAGPGAPDPVAGSGRGRVSSFVPGEPVHGVRLECTRFDRREDVERVAGWLEHRGDVPAVGT